MSDAGPLPVQRRSGDVAIVGAGIIGLACAWEFARRGAEVTIYDSGEPGRGASWAAAGMLAPAFEAAGGDGSQHVGLSELCLSGAEAWRGFAAELEAQSGSPIGYLPGPSLAIAMDSTNAQHLEALATRLDTLSVPVTRLDGAAARRLDPALSERVVSALSLPTDGAVDNRHVISALLRLCDMHPRIVRRWHSRVESAAQPLASHASVLVTAGWQSPLLIDGISGVRPVGGQLLSVRRRPGMPTTTIRSGDLYIAPKADRIVIGATVEPGIVRPGPESVAIEALRQAAERICPVLGDGEELERWSGTRPGSPDHAPILAQVGPGPVFVATGHHRNGILLAPLTARIMADWILEGRIDPLASDLAADRFRGRAV